MLMERTGFYHLHIDNLNSWETLNICDQYLQSTRNHTLFFINAHCFNISLKDKTYEKALLESDLVLNDGIGIRIAAKLKGIQLKRNMNGTDFIPKLINYADCKDKSFYLLGARPNIIEMAYKRLLTKYPDIKIAGYSDGYFNDGNESEIIEKINASKADILIVGMVCPGKRNGFTALRTG
jgi:N-acetylglucosaminyldiphosphoundecaprenol N-acetyl-beta-D-mannosaminyltransferase